MINDDLVYFVNNGARAIALVWVIDTQCVYDLPVYEEHAAIFLGADEVLDISDEYPEHKGITVRFLKEGNILEEFQTTEYFGSILLSNPQVLNLLDYPYGRYVESPNALFVDGKFVILDTDMSGLEPFHNAH